MSECVCEWVNTTSVVKHLEWSVDWKRSYGNASPFTINYFGESKVPKEVAIGYRYFNWWWLKCERYSTVSPTQTCLLGSAGEKAKYFLTSWEACRTDHAGKHVSAYCHYSKRRTYDILRCYEIHVNLTKIQLLLILLLSLFSYIINEISIVIFKPMQIRSVLKSGLRLWHPRLGDWKLWLQAQHPLHRHGITQHLQYCWCCTNPSVIPTLCFFLTSEKDSEILKLLYLEQQHNSFPTQMKQTWKC